MPAAKRERKQSIPASIQGPCVVLVLSVFVLTLVGFVMAYSAGSIDQINTDYQNYRAGLIELSQVGANSWKSLASQVVYALIGAAAAWVIYRFLPLSVWKSWLLPAAWAVTVALILATAAFGTNIYGAQRWLIIGPVSVQSSEVAKVVLALVAVRLFEGWYSGEFEVAWAGLAALVSIALPILILVVWQSDLGTTMICLVAIIAMLWLGEVPARVFGFAAVALVVFFVFFVFFAGDYRIARITSFLNPWNDGKGGLGSGFNLIHSFYAFAEGGVLGVGVGNGHEKYQYLFAGDCDFVFAVIGEELGLVGALIVVALFLAILYSGLKIAHAASDNFGMLLAGSLTIMMVFQAFLNMACAVGACPTTGKPLPFVSSGGSSVVMSMVMVGLILSVAKEAASPAVYDRRRADLRVVSSTRSSARSTRGVAGAPRGSARAAYPRTSGDYRR